jgi:hypothetical protein
LTLPGEQFATGPTVFTLGERQIVAAATKSGLISLIDATSADAASCCRPGSVRGAAADSLATWQEMTITPAPPPAPVAPGGAPAAFAAAPPSVTLGARWILVPLTDSVAAMKLLESGSTISLAPGWMAEGLAAPATPLIVNGVVFVLETGRGGSPAVLHAYEGTTGKELWSSGKTMTAAAAPGSFWSAFGQVYVGTMDGTLYAFGFNDERR